MKNRKFHIDKELKDNYPKPGVAADKAWAEMNKMLGAGVQAPPKPGNGPAITGIKKIFWQYALVTVVVTVTIWGYYRKHNDGKTSAGKTTLAHKNEIKNAQPSQYDTVKALNIETGIPIDKSVAINDSASKINLPATDTGTQHISNYNEKDNAVVSHSDSALAHSLKDKMNIPAIDRPDSGTTVHRNNTEKNNETQIEKKIQHLGAGKSPTGKSFVPPGGATKNNDAGNNNSENNTAGQRMHHRLNLSNHNRLASTGKTTLHSKNNTVVRRTHHPLNLVNHNRLVPTGKTTLHSKNNTVVRRTHHPLNLVNHNRLASTNKYQLSEINIVKPSLPAGIISFIKEPISTDIPKNTRVDSEYLQKLRNAINSLASSKEQGIKSGDKTKDTHKKSATGFDYGLQWDAAIPVQGTTNYFTGTNGNSKPYNIILPQVWLSKGFSNNSKMFLKI
ncbi:MAG: hypothetical protein ABI863_03430, partial [Ginsengibacter sp.]